MIASMVTFDFGAVQFAGTYVEFECRVSFLFFRWVTWINDTTLGAETDITPSIGEQLRLSIDFDRLWGHTAGIVFRASPRTLHLEGDDE